MKKIILTIAATIALGFVAINASAQTTYHGFTDRYGNTTVTSNNGYRANSYTDSYGNTTTRTSNGVTYRSYTDNLSSG